MLIMPPEKKNQKSKKTKGKTSAKSAGAKRTPKRKVVAPVPIQEPTVSALAEPLPEPLALDLSAITPGRLAALSASQFRHGAIFGPAGSGKTHLVREALKINPRWGLLTATTGAPPYYYRHLHYHLPQAAQLLWTTRLNLPPMPA